MNLPKFNYHPDPIATGSVIESSAECVCCGESRGYIYTGPVYKEDELNEALCPWCIADGSAHEKFDASFTDEDGIGGCGSWEVVAEEISKQVAYRTPGFSGWQQERWWTHCGDAAAFIGRVGRNELNEFGQEAIQCIQESTGLPNGKEWEKFFAALDKGGSPTAYLFCCNECGALGGYQDCD